jgi:dihydrofolate reductase
MAQAAAEGMGKAADLLFGRRTYEDFFSVWPSRTDNPFTEVLNKSRKFVASRTLAEPLPWENSILLKGEAATTVAELKVQPGPGLVVLGSGELVRSLLQANLVDELALSIHPLVLGSGQRLFTEAGPFRKLQMVSAKPTTTGVILATYRPA